VSIRHSPVHTLDDGRLESVIGALDRHLAAKICIRERDIPPSGTDLIPLAYSLEWWNLRPKANHITDFETKFDFKTTGQFQVTPFNS
jgi:hypothetical protein